MSSQAQPTELTPGQRMRVTALGLLRALATMVALTALYYRAQGEGWRTRPRAEVEDGTACRGPLLVPGVRCCCCHRCCQSPSMAPGEFPG